MVQLRYKNTKELTAVLYCQKDGNWKVTDFGLSCEATSKVPRTTRFARGTSSYRSPELIRPFPTFTNKVDIWSVGCIFYELLTGNVAFYDDWAVERYDNAADSVLDVSFSPASEFLQ